MIPNLDFTTSYPLDSGVPFLPALNQNAHVVSISKFPSSCTRSPAFAPTTLFLTLLSSPVPRCLILYIHLTICHLSLWSLTSGGLETLPASVPLGQSSLDTPPPLPPNFCYDESFLYACIRLPCSIFSYAHHHFLSLSLVITGKLERVLCEMEVVASRAQPVSRAIGCRSFGETVLTHRL